MTPADPADRHAGRRAARAGPRRPRRSAFAAAGVGLVLAGGLGGFAVGHALAGTNGTRPASRPTPTRYGIPDGPGTATAVAVRTSTGTGTDGGPGTLPDGATPDDPNSSPGDDDRRHRVTVMTPPSRPAPAGARRPAGAPARRDAAVRHGRAVLGLVLGLLLVTYWWVAGGGVQDLGGWADRPDLARPADRPGRLRPAAGAGAADGPGPVLERAFGQDRLARHAPAGRLHLVQPDARPHRARSPGGTPPASSAATPGDAVGPDRRLPRHAARRRPAPSAWSWSWSPASRRPAGGCATSRGTCCTSTPTSASGSPCRTSCGPGRSSWPRPAATVFWWSALGRRPPARSWSGGSACRCGATLRHRLRVTSVVPRGPTASCRST